jgi:hypothetical protein
VHSAALNNACPALPCLTVCPSSCCCGVLTSLVSSAENSHWPAPCFLPPAAVLTKLVRVLAAILAANGGPHPASKQLHEQVRWAGFVSDVSGEPSWPGHPATICCVPAVITSLPCWCCLQVLALLTQSVLPAMSLIPGNAGKGGWLPACMCAHNAACHLVITGHAPALSSPPACLPAWPLLQAWCTRSGRPCSTCHTPTASASTQT